MTKNEVIVWILQSLGVTKAMQGDAIWVQIDTILSRTIKDRASQITTPGLTVVNYQLVQVNTPDVVNHFIYYDAVYNCPSDFFDFAVLINGVIQGGYKGVNYILFDGRASDKGFNGVISYVRRPDEEDFSWCSRNELALIVKDVSLKYKAQRINGGDIEMLAQEKNDLLSNRAMNVSRNKAPKIRG